MPHKKPPKIAKLSPSNSSHWLNCPGYAQGVAKLPPRPYDPTDAAALGTAAHALFESAAILEVDAATLRGVRFGEFIVDDDMIDAVQVALDWLTSWRNLSPFSSADKIYARHECPVELPLGDYLMTGTSDFIGYSSPHDTLTVLDYKHGHQYVNAEGNTQLGLYALAALHKLRGLGHKPKHVITVIAQPRAAPTVSDPEAVRTWEAPPKELRMLHERATEAAFEAVQPDPPRRAGAHCKWCPCAATCRELAEYSLRTAMVEFQDISERPLVDPEDPSTLSMDALAYILQQAPAIDAWLRAVEKEASARLRMHAIVPGFKLVAGRSTRKWMSESAVFKALIKHHAALDTLAPRAPLGPAAMLKLVKDGTLRKRLEELVTKSTPTLTLASEADPRPALVGTASLEFKRITPE